MHEFNSFALAKMHSIFYNIEINRDEKEKIDKIG